MGFVWRRLGASGVNLSRSAFRGRAYWDPPLARVARVLTAVLARPRDAGLLPAPRGAYPVRDLLSLPVFKGLDFFAIERAVRTYRSHHISITYSPRNTSTAADEPNTSWWIALRTSRVVFAPRRLVLSDEPPEVVYKIPSAHWETIREHGIARLIKPLKFSSQPIVPAKHVGDHTFIRLDAQKILDATDYPIYSTFAHGTRPRFHLYSKTFKTNAPLVPPSTFKSATRISVERFPLLLPNGEEKQTQKKKRQKGEEINPVKMVVMQSGMEALERFSCRGLLRGTTLLQIWNAQEAKKRQTNEDSIPPPLSSLTTSRPGRRLSTKDPPWR